MPTCVRKPPEKRREYRMKKRVILISLLALCLFMASCGQYTADFIAEADGVSYTAIHRDFSNGFLEAIELDVTKEGDTDPEEKIYSYAVSLPSSLYCAKCHEEVALSAFSGYRNSGAFVKGKIILNANWDVLEDETFNLTLLVDKFNLPHGSAAIEWTVVDATGEWIDAARISVSYAIAEGNSHVFLAEDGEVYPHGQRFFVTIATPKVELYEDLKQSYTYGETVTVKIKVAADEKIIVKWNGEVLEPVDRQEEYWSYEFKIIGAENNVTVETPRQNPKEL